ncbi:hypothetical protein MUG10_00835 [Xanthomonas prunicola]|uniref:hypothetical protein n=1 Tax=Xanthomonas prunicola TaxID=2053930 RepID=UPI002078CB70|nr:hypothetical protein [Xanthomonas prunicola]USJ00841.1 hypothetical protein MUG10_00835 [Xanthomonas prunicola]
MSRPAPQTILQKLQHTANALLESGKCSEFDIRRITAEAEKLAQHDALGAMEVKAMAAVLRQDYVAADGLYERVLQASGWGEGVLGRYCALLAISGRSMKIKAVLERYKLRGSILSPAARAYIAQLLGYCGWLMESGRMREELMAAGHSIGNTSIDAFEYPAVGDGDEQESEMSLFSKQSYLTVPSVLEKNTVDAEALAGLVGEILCYLRGQGAVATAVRSLGAPRDDGTGSIMVNFVVGRDAEATSNLEWDLYGFLAEKDPALLSTGVVTVGLVSGCQ